MLINGDSGLIKYKVIRVYKSLFVAYLGNGKMANLHIFTSWNIVAYLWSDVSFMYMDMYI